MIKWKNFSINYSNFKQVYLLTNFAKVIDIRIIKY